MSEPDYLWLVGEKRAPTHFRGMRRELFQLSQIEFAAIAGVSQATVSRWETGELTPGYEELRRIREEAVRRGIDWDDSLFFDNDGEAA
jgi:transcriptional regulator with XRE-family HTH domain